MPLQSLDIVRRSATTLPEPEVRGAHTGQVAKLIDTTKCIGCKACQVACMEWNDLRDDIGTCTGHYDNPHDLSEHSWTLMPGMADPQGRLHALRRSRLSQGLSIAGRDRAVRQRHRRFPRRELHRLRLLRNGVSVRRAAHFEERQKSLQMHAVLRPGRRWPGTRLREDLPDRSDRLRHQGGHEAARRGAHRGLEIARLRPGGSLRSGRRRRDPRDVRAAPCRSARALQRPA